MSETVLLILVAKCLIPQSLPEPLETTNDDLSGKGMRVVGWRIKDVGPQLVTLYLMAFLRSGANLLGFVSPLIRWIHFNIDLVKTELRSAEHTLKLTPTRENKPKIFAQKISIKFLGHQRCAKRSWECKPASAAQSCEPVPCPSCCVARSALAGSIPRASPADEHKGGGAGGPAAGGTWAGAGRAAGGAAEPGRSGDPPGNPGRSTRGGPGKGTRAFIHRKCARLANWEAEAALVGLRYSSLSEYNFGFGFSLNPKGKHFIRLKAV